MKLLFFLIIGMLFVGCNYSKVKVPTDNEKFNLPPQEKLQLSYNYVFQKVFVTNCTSCHNSSKAGGGVNLATYAETVKHLDAIKNSVFGARPTMPKDGDLNDEEKSVLWSWIDMGAPELPRSGTDVPPPEPIVPTFESIDKNIFQVTCIKCHTPGESGERILLTKEALLNSPLELVIPDNADESGLIIALERDDDKKMPPPKDGYSPLKPEELKAVRDWINNGAKD